MERITMKDSQKYVDWAVQQCKCWGNNYFPNREEYVKMRDSLDRELALACAENPGASSVVIRAELFCRQMAGAIPQVLPEFDLCGRLSLDGKMCYRHVPEEAVSAEQVREALSKHPMRRFPMRWDHAAAETDYFLAHGIEGELERIRERLTRPCSDAQREFLTAMDKVLVAFGGFIKAHVAPAREQGRDELADSLEWISMKPPRTFHEALLLLHFRFVAWAFEYREAMALGRMDQHLQPFYQADLKAGRITRERAVDLLRQFIALLSVGYVNPVHSLTIGGRLPDESEGVNDVSYMILDVFREQKLPGVNLFARFHEHTPVEFLNACAEVILTGGGMPAMCNEDVSLGQLAEYGVSREDSMKHVFTGCAHLHVEGLQVPWTEGIWLVAVQLVEQLVRELWDEGVEELDFDVVLSRLSDKIETSVITSVNAYNKTIRDCSSQSSPDIFYSVFVDDCIERGCEYNAGGARYPGVYGLDIYGLGLAVDMLAVIKTEVIEKKSVTLSELRKAVESDYKDMEMLRQRLLHAAPKYGNDNDDVDGLATWFVDKVVENCRKYESTMCDGSKLRPIFPGTLGYIHLGQRTGATIDGRHAGEPYSDSGSPVAGRDRKGLTALLNSLGKIDHSGFTGMALNIRLNHRDFQSEAGAARFRYILDVMRAKKMQELQFNCFSTEMLREAQERPEEYANLAIRVAGYSALFTLLQKNEQDAIIARNEH